MIPQGLTGNTVLIVDDTTDSLRFLTDTLEAAGFTVLIAPSGEAALETLGLVTPDLILMDGVMPGLNGFETTRMIKGRTATRHIPIIFMTGLAESEHVIEAFDAGGIDYVRKPIVVDELLVRVRVHLANARAVHASATGLDATGRMLIALSLSGQFLWSTELAEKTLADIAPGWTAESGALPPAMAAMTAKILAQPEQTGAAHRTEINGSTVELVLIAHHRSNELLLRLNVMNPAADVARLQQRHALTLREAEVLLWISYGKPNRVISQILDISPRTVNKHLEQVFEKLGVETRAAAAAVAVKTINP